MLDEYYAFRGWDESGPRVSTLEELDMVEFVPVNT